MNRTPEWIAVDWGRSNLRAWIVDAESVVIRTLTSGRGMGSLTPDAFEPALLDLIAPHLSATAHCPVLVCGMAGARQGWIEAPYLATPCAPPGMAQAVRAPVRDSRLDVRILPGVSQTNWPDVMRGEETQIAGLLASEPEFDGVLCLPGTHSNWVHISAGEIVSFRTFMTGELFALLAEKSVLRFCLEGAGWDAGAFAQAVTDAMTDPRKFTTRLFSLRARSLLEGTHSAISRARLSGLLIGLEIAGARDYWLGRDIVLIGAAKLTPLYRDALAAQSASVREVDGADIAFAGLTAAYQAAKQGAGK